MGPAVSGPRVLRLFTHCSEYPRKVGRDRPRPCYVSRLSQWSMLAMWMVAA